MNLSVEEDENGLCTVILTDDMLKDFPTLIQSCEANGVFKRLGVCKGRIDPQEARQTTVENLQKIVVSAMKSNGFKPHGQIFEEYSEIRNVFGYTAMKVNHLPEQVVFMQKLKDPNTFSCDQDTCCTNALKQGGPTEVMDHFWKEVRRLSVPGDNFLQEAKPHHIGEMIRIGGVMRESYEKARQAAASGRGGEPPSVSSWKQRELCPTNPPSNIAQTYKDSCSQKHVWTQVRDMMEILDPTLKSKEEEVAEKDSIVGTKRKTVKHKAVGSKKKPSKKTRAEQPKEVTLYGAGLQLPKSQQVNITPNFTLSKLGTILDCHPDKFPGISVPFFYIGTKHSCAALHTEDGALWSVNFLHAGAVKIWIVVPPNHVWYLLKCISTTNLPKSHTACSNVLGHKVVLVDVNFLKEHKIPYTVVVQHPGDFVFLEPNAAHLVFNTGWNIAEAANFATVSWIEHGLYATNCDCFGSSQVHLDMLPFLAMFRTDLLDAYIEGKLYSCNHNSQHVVTPVHALQMSAKNQEGSLPSLSGDLNCEASENFGSLPEDSNCPPTNKLPKREILQCLACSRTYEGGKAKINRLFKHCLTSHPTLKDLLERTEEKYANTSKLKSTNFRVCMHCGLLIAGSPANLRRHVDKKHPLQKDKIGDYFGEPEVSSD